MGLSEKNMWKSLKIRWCTMNQLTKTTFFWLSPFIDTPKYNLEKLYATSH